MFTWWDCEDQKEKCAYYYPRDFLAYVHDWKEASDYLDEARLGSPSAFNTLLLLACAGGVKKVGHQAESGTFAAGCDMLALALARWTYKSKSSPAAFAALLAKLERLVAALRLATGENQERHLALKRRLRRLALACARALTPVQLPDAALRHNLPDGRQQPQRRAAVDLEARLEHLQRLHRGPQGGAHGCGVYGRRRACTPAPSPAAYATAV